MEIKQLYEKLSLRVKELEEQQSELLKNSLKPGDLSVAPRLYLRGMFVEFDLETNNLVIKANGRTLFYPLENYDSAWLPFPGHQVLIFQTEQGIRISGFGANGRRLPSSPKESMELSQVIFERQQWIFKHAYGLQLALPIPDVLPDGIGFQLGASYTFRLIDSYPDRFYVLDEMIQTDTTCEDTFRTMMHSHLN